MHCSGIYIIYSFIICIHGQSIWSLVGLIDELAGALLWYIYIFVFMGSPFDPAWAPPPVNVQRANVRPAE